MTTSNATAAAGIASVSITLTPGQARLLSNHVAARLFGNLDEMRTLVQRDDVDSWRLVTASMRRISQEYEDLFDQIAWGEPQESVTVTLLPSTLEYYANQLLLSGVDEAWHTRSISERRDGLREAEAGAAIYDQLEANR